MIKIDYYGLAKKHKKKLKKIKVCAFDIDGILTNGQVFWHGDLGFNRIFHTSDGYGLKVLMQAGYKVGVISGGDSLSIRKRFIENLGLDFSYFGNEDKTSAYLDLLSKGYKDEEILYMGDEFFDLPLLRRCGFSATAFHASPEILKEVDYIAKTPAGFGCVREVIDILRIANGIVPEFPDFKK